MPPFRVCVFHIFVQRFSVLIKFFFFVGGRTWHRLAAVGGIAASGDDARMHLGRDALRGNCARVLFACASPQVSVFEFNITELSALLATQIHQ